LAKDSETGNIVVVDPEGDPTISVGGHIQDSLVVS